MEKTLYPTSYRSISLPGAGKGSRKKKNSENNKRHTAPTKLLLEKLCEFKAGHTMTYQLLRITDMITRNSNVSKTTIMLSLD